ncbi:hypothetical protein MAL01_03855 [Leptospira noguchii]|uniref:hypothetical protein n=1 Tax=Leptospira noguchii TaxID=28182 RepID=UPI001FB7C3A3|nr:hypothetical protein [Leptospira noguchii]UOG35763.1 hypothetical protein MAL02_03750 [Leptospira noguchii]UOG46698.1 hypothetical protein MAL01_03855 [Leptospira noguchii]
MKDHLTFSFYKFLNTKIPNKSFLILALIILSNLYCQKIDIDSRKIFIAKGNKKLPFYIEIEGRNYTFDPEQKLLKVRYPIWYKDPFCTTEACAQMIRVAEAEISFRDRPILTKRSLYEVRKTDTWKEWFPNEDNKFFQPDQNLSNLEPKLKKQIKQRIRFPELSINLLMNYKIDAETRLILYSAFLEYTSADNKELCLVRKSNILDCFSVSQSNFDFLSLGNNRFLLAESYRGTDFRYFEIYKDRFVLEDKSIENFSFCINELVCENNQIHFNEWEIEHFD